jgi:hypothetical protein
VTWRYATLVWVAIIMSGPVEAASSVVGRGAETCGSFATTYSRDPQRAEALYYSWAQGYMSGFNFAISANGGIEADLSALPVDTQLFRLRHYCDDHPLQEYIEAVIDLFEALRSAPLHSSKP